MILFVIFFDFHTPLTILTEISQVTTSGGRMAVPLMCLHEGAHVMHSLEHDPKTADSICTTCTSSVLQVYFGYGVPRCT